MDARPGGPTAKRQPSPEGLGLNPGDDPSAVGAALNPAPLAPVSLGAKPRDLRFALMEKRNLEAIRPRHIRFCRKWNRRSLRCATPDFLSRLVALAGFMRLSLLKAAHVAVAEGRVAGNPGSPRSG